MLRLRSSTLGPGFDPEDIRAVIAGERPIPELPKEGPPPPRRVDLIIDIQNRLAQGKGPAYARWAKVYNLKQMAAALLYLREHGLTDYDALAASTEAAVDRFHTPVSYTHLAPRPGDLVFFVGTYDTAGVSHCGIYVGDGMMIHCGDPISYANLNTSYWQSHFYAYGRLP